MREQLAQIVPRPPLALLEELAAIAELSLAGEPVELPRVVLHLVSGRDVAGRLIRFDRAGTGSVAAVLHDDGHQRTVNVAHVPLASIEAVTVCEALRVGQPTSAATEVTSLELRRAVGGVDTWLKSRVPSCAVSLPALVEADDNEPIAAVLPPLRAALEAVLSDALGAQAIERVSQIVVSAGDETSVELDGGVLAVHAARRRTMRADAAALQAQLEALL